eukprot:4164601-Prymnesium_polylepis.1
MLGSDAQVYMCVRGCTIDHPTMCLKCLRACRVTSCVEPNLTSAPPPLPSVLVWQARLAGEATWPSGPGGQMAGQVLRPPPSPPPQPP